MTAQGAFNVAVLWVDFAVVVFNCRQFGVMRRWGREPDADEPTHSERYATAREWRA